MPLIAAEPYRSIRQSRQRRWHRAIRQLIVCGVTTEVCVNTTDRKFNWAAIYALGAAVLAYFGVINGTALGFGNSSAVALGYLLVALICLGLARQGLYAPIEAPEDAVAEPGD